MRENSLRKVAKQVVGEGKVLDLVRRLKSSRGNNFVAGSKPSTFDKSVVREESELELNLEAYESRDWREHFSQQLIGEGLEIGPLHRPMKTHSQMNVKYIDRYSVEDLRSHYPELNELPLVEPDILGDAETLSSVDDSSFDFIISAHVIEHMKNPLLSLENWIRVLKPGGSLYLIVPDKRMIFDKNRSRTSLEHLILDYLQPSEERDFEHFLDYAKNVHSKHGDLAIEEAQKLVRDDYSIHFHVFIPTDILKLLNWFDQNVARISIKEGPCLAPGSDEFHFLVEKS